MHETNIRSIDLNLLVALKALLEEKHVTRAADKIHLSQPAMSRALGRLRKMLNDPLLVKGPAGLTLTTRASELYPVLQSIFNDINHLISPPTTEPASMTGDIVIATRDNEMVTILPPILNQISKEAPGLTIKVIPFVGNDLSVLDRQQTDFVVTGTESKMGSLYRQVLCKEDFVCLVSAKNPVIKEGLTLKKFLAMKHCLVSLTGYGPGIVDKVLEEQGLSRNVTLRIPHFLAASYVVSDSDLIVTVPRTLGMLLSQQKKIAVLEPPIKIPKVTIYLYWQVRHQNNPIHQWIRTLFANASKANA